MDVSQILDILIGFGVRSDLISTDEKSTYLKYVNLAHQELYALTAVLNPDLVSALQLNITDGYGTLPNKPYQLITVTDNNQANTSSANLKQRSVSQMVKDYPQWGFEDPDIVKGTPQYYLLRDKTLYLVPSTDTTVTINYIPNPQDFVLETPADEIPYPIVFHKILIDGALRYLYQDVNESSVKDDMRIRQAVLNWEMGKGRLVNYLAGYDKEALINVQDYF